MRVATMLACAAVGAVTSTTFAALDPTDASIINLYRFNEATSGDLVNSPFPNQFLDTAPTGTPQNHDDISANGPAWVSGLPVGDGIGLSFDASNTEYTRFTGWSATPQGNYTNGQSFTAMVRLNAATLADNVTYRILGSGLNNISLNGSGEPNTASVSVSLRDQNTQLTISSLGPTNAPDSSGSAGKVSTNKWFNVFLIYSANNTLSVAIDDGTTFTAQTTIGLPSGFDTIGEGFDNAGTSWFVGSLGDGTQLFDGTIESIAIWDKALTLAEADAIDLTTVAAVPEPAMAAMLLLGLAASAARRRRD